MTHPENHRWVAGDQFGLEFPVDPAGLRSGGPRFLTDAFRAAGVLGGDDSVTRITEFHEVAGSSTGRKVALAVEYDKVAASVHTDLFVKFSRDLDDPIRDRGKTQMEPEVRFASLSCLSGFPIAVALCHWNANVDNAWFWRDADGVLRCGLMDWGCVSQMNLGMAIWGAMSGAETDLWDRHFDELLQSFAAEVQRFGGPSLDPDRLRRHTLLSAAVMGIAWLLDVPALIRRRFGAAAPDNRKDPRIKDDESVRAPMQMLSNLLNLWDRTAWATCSTRPSTKRSASPKFAWRAHSISVIPCVTVASVVTNSGFLSVGVRRV